MISFEFELNPKSSKNNLPFSKQALIWQQKINVSKPENNKLLPAWQFLKKFPHFRCGCTYYPWAWHMLNSDRKTNLLAAISITFNLLLLTIILVDCSIVMFLSDMSGRSPLYKKYVQHTLPPTSYNVQLVWCYIYWHIVSRVVGHMCFSVLLCIKN